MTQGALSTRGRRRYAGGGDVEDQYDYATTSDPANDQGSATGALANASEPDLTPDQQTQRINAGAANIQRQLATQQILRGAGINTPLILDPSQAPGAANVPLLAGAGAMLQPTRSGGFSEALGNAFSAAAPAIEKQRALTETAQLRKAQMDNNAAIWGARTGVQQDRNDIYAQRVQDQATIAARVADLRQQGLDERTANHQAMQELGAGKLDAYRDRTQAQTDTSDARIGLAQRNLDLRQRALDALIQQRGIQNDRAAQNAAALEVSRMTDEQIRLISANKDPMGITPPMSPTQAGAGVTQLRTQAGATKPPAANDILPMPASAADAIPGKVYQTARGPARWDGSQFIPVGQ